MFFKKKEKKKSYNLVNVAALLIHAAKIDEDFSKKEEEIIEQTLIEIDNDNNDIKNVLKQGKEKEKNSNQILDFTKEVKNLDNNDKIKIVETLWQIIYSNNIADIYENNLMRRLGGLLYIDPKIMGDIKVKIKKKNSK
tara:strand:- start:103 stop:516 length:414 start_codon:yes stop_codon:yes gene_type:complete